MENDVKQFIDSLNSVKNTFEVNQITTGKKFNCFPISFKQQKSLISTVTDGVVGVLKFQRLLNDIIVENTQEKNWSVVDKIPVILKMRIESLGGNVKTDSGDLDITTIPILKNIDVESLTKKLGGAIDITVGAPTLAEENVVLDYAINLLKKEGDKDVGKNIGNIYTFEIIKFIKSVKFGDNSLEFKDLSVDNRIKVIENLPLSTNKEIVNFIEQLKDFDRSQTKIVVGGEERAFDIDVTFFDN